MTRGLPNHTSKPERLDVPKPSTFKKNKLRKIMDAVVISILSHDVQATSFNKVYVKWPKENGKVLLRPKTWPVGVVKERHADYEVVCYIADLVQAWLYKNHYSDYTPHMLYMHRMSIAIKLTEMSKSLDRQLNSLYNVTYELEEEVNELYDANDDCLGDV